MLVISLWRKDAISLKSAAVTRFDCENTAFLNIVVPQDGVCAKYLKYYAHARGPFY